MGVSYRHWNGKVPGWDGDEHTDEVSFNVGVGFFNRIQLQGVFSTAGTRLRLRGEYFLLGERKDFGEFTMQSGYVGQEIIDESVSEIDRLRYPRNTRKWGPFERGILVSPFIDTNFDVTVYGVGIGLAF